MLGDMKNIFLSLLIALVFVGGGCVVRDSATGERVPVPVPEQGGAEAQGNVTNLRGKGLTAVPASVIRDGDVVTLDISDNRIEGALPAEIRHMQSLRSLDASGNRMTGVPAEIGQLRELRFLDLSDNLLTGLPYELGNLQNLELLDISGNAYSEADLERIKAALPTTTVIRR